MKAYQVVSHKFDDVGTADFLGIRSVLLTFLAACANVGLSAIEQW